MAVISPLGDIYDSIHFDKVDYKVEMVSLLYDIL